MHCYARKMKRAGLVLLCVVILIAILLAIPMKVGKWSTVCTAVSPDGKITAVVRCHTLGILFPRYHYYLSFTPNQAFRPIAGDVTVKTGASAHKSDRVVMDWRTRHYVGYLQELDGVEKRPASIRWEEDGTVCVQSRSGIAGRYEFRRDQIHNNGVEATQ